jgi:alpha-L-fucosidase
MFIHWGFYSVYGHHEWAMEEEGIPMAEYEQLARQFKPKPNAARAWAKLAKQAGQKYMVMTTKHHEGFCNWDTKLTNYCAPQHGPGRDLVAEFVEAARAEGLRVGFYYSLMDWHHPDGARCATNEAARQRFVEYTHGLVRELMTNYGKIDVLWYDVDWPLDAKAWESEKMNAMVFKLQPDIIVNDRNGLPGDFSTPEQHITSSKEGRAWESCMTMNDSWGYQRVDDDWKSAKTLVRNVIRCAQGGGNYLPCKGNTLYVHVYNWHGGGGRLENEGYVRQVLYDRAECEVQARGVPSAVHRDAGAGSRTARHHSGRGVRERAGSGQHLDAPRASAPGRGCVGKAGRRAATTLR